MTQRILIAFDDSENAMRAVHYVANYLTRDSEVTLFSVLQDTSALCNMNSPALTPYFKSQQSNFCLLEDKKKELILESQQAAKDHLIAAGFGSDKIRLQAEVKDAGVARDIITRAQSEFDLIVIGRRGLSAIREFLFGSVSQKVLHLAKDISVLVVN